MEEHSHLVLKYLRDQQENVSWETLRMAERIGQQLGNYRLIRLLGRGAFAEVYLGEHLHLGTQVAVKVLRTQLASNDLDKFRTEARIIARLEHPHIVRVFDFGVEGDIPYLVMDYAPHGTLRQRHPRNIPVSLERIVPYVKQVASALQFAHDQKLIHRDVKPENMLLNRNDDLLLSDFGLVVIAQSSESLSTQEMAGTIPYMAPEQLQGKPRPASDQYALGVVVYEWLSGDRPFQGSFFELASQQMHVPPPPLHAKIPTISSTLERVVLKALAKDPQERFARVEDFALAFEQVAQHTPHSEVLRSPTPAVEQPQVSTDAAPSPTTSPGSTLLISSPGKSPEFDSAPFPTQKSLLGNSQSSSLPIRQRGDRPLLISRRFNWMSILGLVLIFLVVTVLIYGIPLLRSGTTTSTLPATLGLPYPYRGHTGGLNSVAWSPNGKRIASAGGDKDVQVWDATTGKLLLKYTGHSKGVNGVTWSPDGKRIASASGDMTVQVWDASTAKPLLTYTNHTASVDSVAWSPDGKYIASGSADMTVQIWDANTGKLSLRYTGHNDDVGTLAWSPDSKRIASSSDRTVQVWNVSTGKTLFTYRGHNGGVHSVTWSPDGKRIASASGDRTVQVWDASTGSHIFTYLGHTDSVHSVAWSPNGKYIASGGDDQIVQVWDANTGSQIYTFKRHNDGVNTVAWAPDSKRIVSGSGDDHAVWVWYALGSAGT